MRRPGSVLALFVALAAVVLAPTAAAKTLKVDWRERMVLPDGALKFRVTKIVATTQSWTVAATIQNASESRVDLEPRGGPPQVASPRPLWTNGIALIEAHRAYTVGIGGHHFEWWQHPATKFAPALPRSLAAGGSWTGTFGGRAKLRTGQAFSIGFGLFLSQSEQSGGRSLYWITDHSFTL